MMKKMILGIVGLPCSGKTTASKYFVSKKFYKVTLSDFIKEELVKNNLIISRISLQDMGNKLRLEFGPEYLVKLAYEKIIKQNINFSIIDGIRNINEIEFLRKIEGFILLAIVASPKVRYQRLTNRDYEKKITFEKFLNEEKREEQLGSKKTGLRVSECIEMADYKITNNLSVNIFNDKLSKLLDKLIL